MTPLAHPSKNTRAKGRRLERLARQCLEAQGFRVETAPNTVVWIKDPTTGHQKPISTHHDFFRLWDLLAVGSAGDRGFVQVATLDTLAHRRAKILASGFPGTRSDILAGYKGGRDRHFRLFRGPRFERWDGECWRPPAPGAARAPRAIRPTSVSQLPPVTPHDPPHPSPAREPSMTPPAFPALASAAEEESSWPARAAPEPETPDHPDGGDGSTPAAEDALPGRGALEPAEDGAEEDAEDGPGQARIEGELIADRHRHGEDPVHVLPGQHGVCIV